MKILVRQLNGLGNQLFRYAAALYFAEKLNAKIENIVQFDRDPLWREQDRPFLLDHFAISGVNRSASAFDRFVQSEKPLLQTLGGPLRGVSGTVLLDEPSHYRFTPLMAGLERAQIIYLRGFFQVANYAQAIPDTIRREFSFKAPPEGRNRDVHDRIQADPNAVSIHFRRTDYVTLDLDQKPLGDDYYRQAIMAMETRLGTPSFYVFSDDIAYARERFGDDDRFQFIDHNDNDTSYEDIRLMAACRHHIIANSTFSWWGAWLNNRPGKTVIAPRRWLGVAETHFPDIYPTGWTVLGD